MAQKMTRAWLAALALLSALNLIALAFNLTRPSQAATGAMSYEELRHNADFTRAVKSIVQACTVNVDIAQLKC